ncbi:hypothetical protein ABFS82_11G123300 [Erythranthe guttata]|uniref:uncharacterized protein LOC105960953 n=1 Tax=Erythranthe guttata TaxID=4155 RepID=UPI00064E0027|nr:PREDICTED: uncharacterized protein LOC105960953 [Erythranthe guttata]|eukprot:XP_012840627.1 PREDICTED: uncharacterized protein LOC105960953 [Erythranthe guttata]
MGKPRVYVEDYVSATEELIKEIREIIDITETYMGKYVDIPAILKLLKYPLPRACDVFPELITDDNNDDDDDDDGDDDDSDDEFVEMMSKKVEQLDNELDQVSMEMTQTVMMMGHLALGKGGVHPHMHIHNDKIVSISKRFATQVDKAIEIYHEKLGLPPYVNPIIKPIAKHGSRYFLVEMFKRMEQQHSE